MLSDKQIEALRELRGVVDSLLADVPKHKPLVQSALPARTPCVVWNKDTGKYLRWHTGTENWFVDDLAKAYPEDTEAYHQDARQYTYFRPVILPDWTDVVTQKQSFLVVREVSIGNAFPDLEWYLSPAAPELGCGVVYIEERPGRG